MAASLLRRDKKSTAAHLKAELNRTDNSSGVHQLQELLDSVLNPERPAGDTGALEWCKCLLAGGEVFEEFCKTVRSYDNATLCGLVWTANFVAYRCRTCGISPCMSLCAECFNSGDHTGHDFNMFRSQAGGACDCGDSNVMRESGFCRRHRSKTGTNVPSVPRDLLLMSEMVLPRFIIYIIQYLRDGYSEPGPASERDLQKVLQQLEPQISFLEELTKMGGAMRTVLTKILTNQQSYKDLTMGQEENVHAKKNYDRYLSALKSSGLVSLDEKNVSGVIELAAGAGALSILGAAAVDPVESSIEDDQDGSQGVGQRKRVKLSSSTKDPSIMDVLKHKCFLEELLFWTVKYEFPQKMVTFLLNMLPDQDYKISFTRTFVQHYAFIMKTLMKSHESDTMSNRIVHISVQLFSNEELARHVTEECQLLDIMVTVLLYMMESCLVKSELQDEENNRHVVVNCGEALLKNNTYWPLISDFINILSHQSVAKKFLEDQSLLMLWMSFVSFFQGMNLNKREINEHVEFESQTYYAAFAAELEACAQPMWGLLTHCKVKETQEYTKTVVRYCLETLQIWFDSVNFVDEPTPHQVSFHLPLHRYYAMFLSKAVKYQGLDLDSLLPDQEMLMKIMIHPLQIQASLSEIHSNMWVRNGLQIKGQAMTYVQSHFCNSMIDPDIYLLQICASRLDPDYFISSVFERFKVVDLLTMASQHQNTVLDPEHERPMLEGSLTFLVLLLSLRIHLGMADDDILRAEMVSQLCMNDRTHSALLDLIPENPNPKSGIVPGSSSFEAMLSAVADFKAPVFEPGGSMQQGMYTPKAEVWEKEFDPIMVILRTVYRRDVQTAMDRYTAFLKESDIFSGNPWPPYKERTPLHPCYKSLVRLLHCKTLHIVLFTLLYKISMDHQNMSEHVLCMVLYLIELGLDNVLQEEPEEEEPCIEEHCHDSWFPGTNLLSNLHHVINFVRVRVPETAPEVKREPPASTSTDSSSFAQTSRRFSGLQRQNSGAAQVFSLVAERRRKFQEIINRSSGEASQAVRPKSSATKWIPNGSTPQLTTAILEIRESMISLLIKLHHKLSAKQNSFCPPWIEDPEAFVRLDSVKYSHGDGISAIERILTKAALRARQNKRCIQEICMKISPPVPPKKNGPADKKTMDKEERRQKARERQQKLLAEFASRQKSFMETAMDVESPDADVAMDLGSSEQQDSEILYDCVICGQSGPSTEDRPTGLVILLQASSVLGHRCKSTEPKKLPTSDEEHIYPVDTCGATHDVRLTTLQRFFNDSSCLQSVSIGWEGGVYVQTCGHTLHIDCHKSYMESLRSDQVLQGFSVDKGEFTCPLCRQFANSVLPCYPGRGVEKAHCQTPSNKNLSVLVKEVEDLQEQMGTFSVSTNSETNLSREMESVIKDIKNTTQKKYMDYSKTPGSPDNDFLFMYSVARTNLELELVHRGGNLCCGGASATAKRSCLNQLFHVLAMHMRLYSIDSAYNPWTRLTQLTQKRDSYVCNDERPEVPLLFRDVPSLLIIFVLTMPQPLHKEHFTCIVKVLYTLQYIHAIATLSVKFSAEERLAWKNSGALKKHTPDAEKSWEVLLSHGISELSKGNRLYEVATEEMSMISSSVWSPQSIEYALQQFCLPFLRISSLLQHHLFGDDLPSCLSEEEFPVLANCLGILPSAFQPSNQLHSASCLDWSVSAFEIISQWCSEVTEFADINAEHAVTLVVQDPHWTAPRLLHLPENYNTIFQYYHRKACTFCNKVPKDPALCLVCGTFVCLKGPCCKQQNYCECVLHSQNCGAGTGIFLLINASVIIIIRGHRFCIWGAVYLDAHGEEDRDLRRGKPLYLCEERYKVLEQQWVSHTFDHINKRWGPHYNGL
ncbi:E3 ubiquitin-protein ligase ubr3-like isoform X1 [Polyodon spathula]|uniref:E3 ubiquitin-protein ligase ubr3-like isoform X1 n=1 Tax=Polyodon spathula TaxID=7913 RepID=UPI001B7EA6CA|nr:E3 ubiquitin-protein ligase ubr3-like isoform X1 [Polyodon spathula]XP_041117840.1 E3 ubiquitin-protein ligase ubr3-like isoform X1 [Polyodon spathula]